MSASAAGSVVGTRGSPRAALWPPETPGKLALATTSFFVRQAQRAAIIPLTPSPFALILPTLGGIMAASVRPPFLPQCALCVRKFTRLGLEGWKPLQQQQSRGLSRNPKSPETITVKLLKDVRSYGRKGAIVPVAIGRMRNLWFPQRIAEYIMRDVKKELKAKNVTIERDPGFVPGQRLRKPKKDTVVPAQPAAGKQALELLTPQRSMELLQIFTPTRLNFFRTPIDLEAKGPSPQQPTGKPHPISIHGSVTASDIAASFRAALANNDEAGRVVLLDDDIRFVGKAAEEDPQRVKQLGKFDVEIRVKGVDNVLKRHIRVLPNPA
ncbi:hypothetical protein M501DRAFT_994912 [Patellaria atrata CBS 101060]|uniref:Ribosomal protein L9 domain-containing protein n=1 Tax=Patellaria atrata CBS 101060 TaxID=1346257 RepID=A0A9P4VQD6_9PEZI|nr:hypothetical protein M501DRAFT_994912 [Patellaria atrata CBS 101060]